VKAFKYKLEPNKTQEAALERTLVTCRYLYNSALAERIDKYKADKTSVTYVQQANALSDNKNEWQEQVHSQVLQDVLKRLDKSFKNFFTGLKSKRRVGFPRFKNDRRFRSFCYPQSGFKLLDGKIRLSKIGDVRLKLSRPTEGKIKTCAIVKDVDQWFVVLTCETGAVTPHQNGKPMIGVDVGIKSFCTMSDGSIIGNPRTLVKSQKKLAKVQKRLSRKVKGSKRRNKQRIKVAKVHRKIRRQRDDFLHKTSTTLAKKYGTIVFEDLNIAGMMQNHCLAKHIGDASWNKLIQLTTYKAESAGGRVLLVDARGTSQRCSGCGEKVSKTLADRIHCCPHCGLVMDRDENAAVNIHTAGSAEIYAQGDGIRRNDFVKTNIISQPSAN
jgi:putative transposase